MNTELTQAEQNRAKILKFIGSIAMQIVIFSIIVGATVNANYFAGLALTIYALFAHLALVVYGIISIVPTDKLAKGDLSKFETYITPSSKVARGISTIFSIAEIALFINFGFFYLAGLWIVIEILQRLMLRKVERAIALQNDNQLEIIDSEDDEAPTKTLVASVTVDEFEQKIAPELDKLQKEANQIDARLRKLFSDNNGAPPPEGSLNYKEMLELDERKEQLFEEVEAVILRAGGQEPSASE